MGPQRDFPKQALAELAALGTFGIVVPEDYGGAGMDTMALAIALEEIAAGDGSTSTIISVNNCPVCAILLAWANEAQKQKYLVPLARETARRFLSDRATRRIRCVRFENDCRARRGQLGLERRQTVHYQRQNR